MWGGKSEILKMMWKLAQSRGGAIIWLFNRNCREVLIWFKGFFMGDVEGSNAGILEEDLLVKGKKLSCFGASGEGCNSLCHKKYST